MSRIGRWTVGVSAAAGALWFAMPLVSGILDQSTGALAVVRDGAMTVAIVVVIVAAVMNVLCLWRWQERSVLNILATCLTVPLAFVGAIELVQIAVEILGSR